MDACLFTVSDQPWLRGETILALLEVFLKEGKGIACVEYDGKLGNPCVFSERYYGELMGLEGDVGGKRVVVRNRKDVAVMRVVDGREVMDVDVATDAGEVPSGVRHLEFSSGSERLLAITLRFLYVQVHK